MRVLTESNLAQIVVDLLAGKTVVFPTETSYGLGCDAANQAAVDRIFGIKGRKSDKPLLAVVPTVAAAKKYLVWNGLLEAVAGKYWPGAVTVVGEYKNNAEHQAPNIKLADGVISREHTVAVRVTAHPLLKSITEKLGRPLVATSANIADGKDNYSAAAVAAAFQNRALGPEIILDYGTLPKRPPTTVVSVVGGVFKVLRQGGQLIKL